MSSIASIGESLLDYLFLESCRICRGLIYKNDNYVKTVCGSCWQELDSERAQITFLSCSFSRQQKKLEQATEISDSAYFVTNYSENFSFEVELAVAHALSYKGSAKKLIHKLKYSDDRLIADDLSELLLRAFDEFRDTVYLSEKNSFGSAIDMSKALLVPIPLFGWKKLKRGFNQSELLAQRLAGARGISLSTGLLIRKKNTVVQHKLSKQERSANMKGAFVCNSLPIAKDTPLILVDDILTSGATLIEASITLRQAGFEKIFAITLARADLHNELPGIPGD